MDLGVSLADRLRDALVDGDAHRIQELVESGASLAADKVRNGTRLHISWYKLVRYMMYKCIKKILIRFVAAHCAMQRACIATALNGYIVLRTKFPKCLNFSICFS